VITSYNKSRLYAAAVTSLAEAIRAEHACAASASADDTVRNRASQPAVAQTATCRPAGTAGIGTR
jgi:hypothetical protein